MRIQHPARSRAHMRRVSGAFAMRAASFDRRTGIARRYGHAAAMMLNQPSQFSVLIADDDDGSAGRRRCGRICSARSGPRVSD
jgi:hypothetical protein